MAAPNTPSAKSATGAAPSGESATTKVQKRYETLAALRSRAVKGKGAWYWTYLEPVLLPDPTTGLPSSVVKLRCCLCRAAFSASNPSRTASEHLKCGTCPRLTNPGSGSGGGASVHVAAVGSIFDQPTSPQSSHYFRKHGQQASSPPSSSPAPCRQISPLAVADPRRFSSPAATDAVPSSSSTPPTPPQQLHGHHLSHHVVTSQQANTCFLM